MACHQAYCKRPGCWTHSGTSIVQLSMSKIRMMQLCVCVCICVCVFFVQCLDRSFSSSFPSNFLRLFHSLLFVLFFLIRYRTVFFSIFIDYSFFLWWSKLRSDSFIPRFRWKEGVCVIDVDVVCLLVDDDEDDDRELYY